RDINSNFSSTVQLDEHNYLGKPFEDYSDTELTPSAIINARNASLSNSIITRDMFRELYDNSLRCSFLGRACNYGQPDDSVSSSSSSSQSSQSTLESSSSIEKSDCGIFSWAVPCVSEPYYYVYQDNYDTFLRQSPMGTLYLDAD